MANPTPAIIPARGGSKGIPRKNLKLLEGKPLIVWSIEQVLATRGLTPYVSTEDEEIADVARGAGAQVIERPEELAGDAARVLEILSRPKTPRVGDRSTPEQIFAVFALSKKAFKRAVGRLLKEGSVFIGEDGFVRKTSSSRRT